MWDFSGAFRVLAVMMAVGIVLIIGVSFMLGAWLT